MYVCVIENIEITVIDKKDLANRHLQLARAACALSHFDGRVEPIFEKPYVLGQRKETIPHIASLRKLPT